MIMTSHILYPDIDADAPVTLSRRFATQILRDELGFDGVAVSDDIGMGAMKGVFDAPDAAADFIAAGCDMLMVCAHLPIPIAPVVLLEPSFERSKPAVWTQVCSRARGADRGLLERTPMNEVRQLPESVLSAHSAAGDLFAAPTVEVV